jgi:peptidyl-prolyl cis-trans isomerase SDCCAG10
MSDEPQTSGKVVLHTSGGDLQIELWCKEAPRCCRNFLQLAMEGFYDNTLFHRLVPKYILQGGLNDARQSPAPFAGELNNRLKFTRRGLLAMVNTEGEGKKITHSSQFFFTLGAAPDLDLTCSIFGRVVGDTIFNLVRMGETLPIEDITKIKILGIKIVINPFDDIIVREVSAEGGDLSRKRKLKTSLTFDIKYQEEKKVLTKDPTVPTANSKKLLELQDQIKKLKKEIKSPSIQTKKETTEKDANPTADQKKSLIELEREKYLARYSKHCQNKMDTLVELNKFKTKLSETQTTGHGDSPELPKDVLIICKLHGLANCQSCRDTFGLSSNPDESLGDSNSWMLHRLVFAESEYSRQLKEQQRQDLQDLEVSYAKKHVSKN